MNKVKIETCRYAGIYKASKAQLDYIQGLMRQAGKERQFVLYIGKLDNNDKNRYHLTISTASKLIECLKAGKEFQIIPYEPVKELRELPIKVHYKAPASV
jgi:hypothetical protein